jgi:nucleoside-diphosphate-sugar epimerase
MKLIIFGFGYTSKTLARNLLESDASIVGTTRTMTPDFLQQFPSVKLLDFHADAIKAHLRESTHILISIPPVNAVGDIVLSTYAASLAEYTPNIKWIGYLSSTGVYGDHHGEWVNEESSCTPTRGHAMARYDAEQQWVKFSEANNLPLHIFRLSGIYGHNRNALVRIKQGKQHSIVKEGHFFSRIHVDDIVQVLTASMREPAPLSIYNVADDEPCASHLVDDYATNLLGIKPLVKIPFDQANMSVMEREFYASNRRVSNHKIKHSLHIMLKFPSYREGLSQIWRDDFSYKN